MVHRCPHVLKWFGKTVNIAVYYYVVFFGYINKMIKYQARVQFVNSVNSVDELVCVCLRPVT